MDLTFREWLVVAGGLIILVIIMDAWRRIRRDQKEQEAFRQAMAGSEDIPEDYNPELPNGGARVVRPALDASDVPASAGSVSAGKEARISASEATDVDLAARKVSSHDGEEEQAGLSAEGWGNTRDFDEAYPEETGTAAMSDVSATNLSSLSASELYEKNVDEQELALSTTPHEEIPEAPSDDRQAEVAHESSMEGGERVVESESSLKERVKRGFGALTRKMRRDSENDVDASSSSESDPSARQEAFEILVMHVESKDEEGFSGAILRALLEQCGLNHGAYRIFHRHEEDSTDSPVQFSVSNSFEPGYFDLDTMDHERFHGISFFLRLPGPTDNMFAFDCMLGTAQAVVDNLGGDLKDENHSVITPQTIEHCRQRIREFERRQKLTLVH